MKNSCPGACLFYFEVGGKRYLHTGDFRATQKMLDHPCLVNGSTKVFLDGLYLDTTYCDPLYRLPNQDNVVQVVCELIRELTLQNESLQVVLSGGPLTKYFAKVPLQPLVSKMSNGWEFMKPQKLNFVFIVGSYSIGKERLFFKLAESLGCKIHVTYARKRMLQACFSRIYLDSLLTDDPNQAQIHIVPMGQLNETTLKSNWTRLKSRFKKCVAIRPTGWTHSNKSKGMNVQLDECQGFEASPFKRSHLHPRQLTDEITVLPVPYSEHSSVTELEAFVRGLNVTKVIPTVNMGNPETRDKMMSLIYSWIQ